MSASSAHPVKKKSAAFPMKGCGIRGAKWVRHQRKGSATSGRIKVKTCQATWLQRSVSRYNRSYQQVDYTTIMASIDRKAGRLHAVETHGLGKRANNLVSARRAAAA